MNNKNEESNFLAGFIVGAVLGITAGFLYAPRRGSETRELLKQKVEVARERVTDMANRIKVTADEIQQKIQDLD